LISVADGEEKPANNSCEIEPDRETVGPPSDPTAY